MMKLMAGLWWVPPFVFITMALVWGVYWLITTKAASRLGIPNGQCPLCGLQVKPWIADTNYDIVMPTYVYRDEECPRCHVLFRHRSANLV